MAQHVERVDTVIVGAGQAGLSVSHELTAAGRDHLVLERGPRPANSWRYERWDGFHLNSPNWSLRLAGAQYRGAQPDAFLARDDIARYLEAYADAFDAPVRCGVRVSAVSREPGAQRFRVETDQGTIEAANVVVATGLFHGPQTPAAASNVTPDVLQIHSSAYRNAAALPPGAVLVVGTAQSGCQIAEDLHKRGRTVYLSVSGAGRGPRRYRGRDVFYWLIATGFFARPFDLSYTPPHVSGDDGGHTINLHAFARDGIHLLGRVQDIEGDEVRLARDLHEKLANADGFERQMKQMVDGFIARSGMDAPIEEEEPPLRDGFDTPLDERINLADAGITSIIWATGYRRDFRWVHAPVFGENGLPILRDARTAVPGLYFAGMSTLLSHILAGTGDDAVRVAAAIEMDARERVQGAAAD